MKLRLAEYKNGKFERFLELGKDFGYFGDFILVSAEYCRSVDPTAEIFALDKKDPLNRFDGLFDGRTYGDGKFVLIISDQDDIVQMGQHFYQRCFDDSNQRLYYLGAYILGNLHENPELFLKIHG